MERQQHEGRPSAEALYEEGVRAFNDKKYVRAIDNFTKLRSDHPFSPLITQTELKMAEAYYFNEQYPEAINALKNFKLFTRLTKTFRW